MLSTYNGTNIAINRISQNYREGFMTGIGIKIGEIIKVILAVLGIISAYPDVTIDNIFVYKDFQNSNIIKTQFHSYNLINPSIRDIIESGIDVNIIYQIKTTIQNKIVYKGVSVQRVSFQGTGFSVNHKGKYSFDLLTNAISVNEMIILTNSNQKNNPIQTDIEILINCDATPEIVNLWGNKPKLSLTYSLGAGNED